MVNDTFTEQKRHVYGVRNSRFLARKVAFSGCFITKIIAQNRLLMRICRQLNGLRLHTKTAVIYVLMVLISK